VRRALSPPPGRRRRRPAAAAAPAPSPRSLATAPTRRSRDESLQLLSDPLVVEDFKFSDLELPSTGKRSLAPGPLRWQIDGGRVARNEQLFLDELRREGAPDAEARPLAAAVSTSLSGVALWPRLILDEAGTLVVESRGPRGEHQKSHWQTVLPLLAARPVRVEGGAALRLSYEVDVRDGKVDTPLVYSLEAEIE
jgi:hypothetical protein